MRWYFAIDERGGLGETGEYAKLAVKSALAAGGLEPVLLYYGARTAFTDWMQARGVRIAAAVPGFLDAMNAAVAAGKYRPHSIGHWLRVVIPQIEQEREFVLYTDCDVIFLRGYDWRAWRPRAFAAAPEFSPERWTSFNAGVMVMNVPAMRASYPAFEQMIRYRIEQDGFHAYDDQFALNESYKGLWDRLDTACNWKPYWKYSPDAAVLHFHGPKPPVLEAIAQGRWDERDDAARFFAQMVNARLENYLAWTRMLGDFLQVLDFPAALQFARLSSALTRYAERRRMENVPAVPDPEIFMR